MKIAILTGTRPNYIKAIPIVKAAEDLGLDVTVIDARQHYDPFMREVFLSDIIGYVEEGIKTGSGPEPIQISRAMISVYESLKDKHYDIVIVIGDTNSAMASLLTAVKLGFFTAHVEAGARAKIRTTEDINRRIMDHIADVNFAPTPESYANLALEGLKDRSYLSYDPLLDAFLYDLDRFGIEREPEDIILVTYHRRENLKAERLKWFYSELSELSKKYHVIFPIHPHTRKVSESLGILPEGVEIIDPLDRKRFLRLLSQAKVTITDSGGVVRESAFMRVPSIVPREDLERRELLRYNAAELVTSGSLLKAVDRALSRKVNWDLVISSFGDGKASYRIIKTLTEALPRLCSFYRL